MRDVDTIITEIKEEFSNFEAVGLIDDLSVYRWVSNELRRFGRTMTVPCDTVVEIKNKKGFLPENYYALNDAYWCEPLGYECTEESKPFLQNSLIWKERVERTHRWDSCDVCCKIEEEKVITEKLFINGRDIKFHYHNKQPVRLVKGPVPNKCLENCKHLFRNNSPHEIQINERTLYANFSGNLYVSYDGIPFDENGCPMIKDTDLGRVETYIENFIKFKIFEKMYLNGDEKDIQQKVSYLRSIVTSTFREAMLDAKMSDFSFDVYEKMKLRNRAYAFSFERPYLRK